MNNKEYHNLKSLGSSLLKMLLKNALMFRLVRDGVIKIEGEALDVGSFLHAQILEPQTISTDFAIIKEPISKKELAFFKEIENKDVSWWEKECLTKSGKLGKTKQALASQHNTKKLRPAEVHLPLELFLSFEFWRNNKEKILISNDNFELTERLARQLYTLPNFAKYIKYGVKEKDFHGELDGVQVRIKPDCYYTHSDGSITVLDLKTTAKELISKELRDINAKYMWYLQEALYRLILEQNGFTVRNYLFAVTSKVKDGGAIYFENTDSNIGLGEKHIELALQKYKYCQANDIWLNQEFDFENNCFYDVLKIDLPVWAYYQFEK